MKDIIVVGALILSFALFVTAHVAIAYGLVKRTPRWHGAVAFFVPVVGLFWAWREKMRIRVWIGTAALILYVIATIVARF